MINESLVDKLKPESDLFNHKNLLLEIWFEERNEGGLAMDFDYWFKTIYTPNREKYQERTLMGL